MILTWQGKRYFDKGSRLVFKCDSISSGQDSMEREGVYQQHVDEPQLF